MDENNSDFNLVIRNLNDIYQLLFFIFVDCVGNPNVYHIRDELNTLSNGYNSDTYDMIKKNSLFTRTKAQDMNNNKIYSKFKNCGDFLGFSKDFNNKEIKKQLRGYIRTNLLV
jgi:hypothetical protein